MAAAHLLTALGCAAALALGCSLGNVSHDDCKATTECTSLFGLGSECKQGYCTDPPACVTDADCRATFGAGVVCEAPRCVAGGSDARCSLAEPPELVDAPGSLTDRIVIGAMFKIADEGKEAARANAAILAVRQINASNGIQGTKLGLLVCNNDSNEATDDDAEETAELTRHLAGAVGVPVMLGPSSSANALVATDLVVKEQLRTAIVSPSATSPSLSANIDRFAPDDDPFGLFWRTCPSDALQGEVLADEVAQVPMLQRVAIVLQDDPYGQGLLAAFQEAFQGQGSAQVSSFPFDPSDEAELVQRVQSADVFDPQAWLVVSSDVTRTLAVLGAAAGLPNLPAARLFLTDGSKDQSKLLADTVASEVSAMLADAIGTAPAPGSLSGSPTYSTFADAFELEFGVDPAQFSFVAQAYDAAYVAAYGVAFASVSPTFDGFGVADGMSRLVGGPPEMAIEIGPNDFTTAVSGLRSGGKVIEINGTSGALDFDPFVGEAPGPIEVWTITPSGDAFMTKSVVSP